MDTTGLDATVKINCLSQFTAYIKHKMLSIWSEKGQKKKHNEPHHEKTNFLVSDLVQHKLGCTATEYGLRLEISDLERTGIALSM